MLERVSAEDVALDMDLEEGNLCLDDIDAILDEMDSFK
jgi:hypothetical protein